MHLGTKRHGADDITSGERNNLIIWNHGIAFRQVRGDHGIHAVERSGRRQLGVGCRIVLAEGVGRAVKGGEERCNPCTCREN